MDKDFILGSIIWGTAITTILCTLIGWGITATNNDHSFDIKCIESGKELTYIIIPGDSYSKKVCK